MRLGQAFIPGFALCVRVIPQALIGDAVRIRGDGAGGGHTCTGPVEPARGSVELRGRKFGCTLHTENMVKRKERADRYEIY